MKEQTENKEIKKAGDFDYPKISDQKKLIQDFIKLDDKKHLLLFTLIGMADREQSELIECLLLKMFDAIKDEMSMSNFYSKEDLADVNFFLYFIKQHINHLRFDDVDLSHDRGVGFLNMFMG